MSDMIQRRKGDRYRPIVTVMAAIDGIPVKVKMSGKTYVLKAFKQKKGRWSKRSDANENMET